MDHKCASNKNMIRNLGILKLQILQASKVNQAFLPVDKVDIQMFELNGESQN